CVPLKSSVQTAYTWHSETARCSPGEPRLLPGVLLWLMAPAGEIPDNGVVLRSTEMVNGSVTVLWFATTRSGLPSPSRSPLATFTGKLAVPAGAPLTSKGVGAPNPPLPSPSRIETVLSPALATARSGLQSPLKSPTAAHIEKFPAAKAVGALNP